MSKEYAYEAVLHEEPDGGAYVVFPYDLRQEFGKGRVKVHAEFDGIPYDGSIINMGVKDDSGKICYIIGVLKSIRKKLGIANGDRLHVRIIPKEDETQEILLSRQKPRTVDEYIDLQEVSVRPRLQEIRSILRAVLPEAEERISWSMPTYRQGRNIIHFAAFKHHLGLYPGDEAVGIFAEELKGYDVSKGAIRFPWSADLPADLPADLIRRIARWCLAAYGN